MGIFLFATASKPALRPTHPPIHYVPEAISPEIKAHHSPPSSTEVKNAWSYTSTPPHVFVGAVLSSVQGQFTFNLTYTTEYEFGQTLAVHPLFVHKTLGFLLNLVLGVSMKVGGRSSI
jgi:hypothetical protein